MPEVDRVGNKLRWAMLVVLLAVAAGAAWRRAPLRVPRSVVGAAWLLLLAVASSGWSVAPRSSFEHAVSFAILVVAAALAALACAREPERPLLGILAGAVAVAVGGLVLLAVDRHWALRTGSTGVPTRFRGLGVDANTASLLYGIALPIAVFAFLRSRSRRQRAAAAAAFLLLDGSVVGSGSRAPIVGGFAASLLVAVLAPRLRVPTAAVLVALLGLSVGLGTIPKPLATNPPAPAAASQPTPKPGYYDAETVFPLEADIGRPLPGHGIAEHPRSLTGSSGRLEAWKGALHQAALRPIAGHGFGTEDVVFVDRYFFFAGGVPENSYIGLLLELGGVGLLSFLAVFAAWIGGGARAWRAAGAERRLVIAAAGSAFASGLLMAVVQSYFYSAGNIASLSLWLCGLVLAVAAAEARSA